MRANLEKLVKEELSGEAAKNYVSQITQFHRIQASTMFYEAAKYVKDALSHMGFADAQIERFPSDGAKKYWTWTSPVGWEVTSAELHMTKPKEKLIVRYKDVPTCLHTYSKATLPAGVTAELIDVGEGTKPEHYEGKDVRGKFVLATGRARRVHEQAVYKHGAAGVITDTLTYEMENVRESVDIPDAHAYQSIWPTKPELNKVTFGFSLNKRQGNHLRALIRNKKTVVLKAKVEASLFPGHLDIVTATIRGTSNPEEEIFLIAHLCHPKPSANDNASGSGLLLEIANTMQRLISSGRIPKPKRTIRFLWVPETYGTIAYLHHHEDLVPKLVAGINLDMVGQNQDLCRSTLNLDKTPDSNPSYLNDYIFSLLERSVEEFDPKTNFGSASTFRYSVNAFSGGSDHAEFNDSTFSVPCIMLLQWPDLYYHTSMDSIDKVSMESLKRVGWIATVAALTLASATAEEAVFMANLARLGAMTRLQEASKEALAAMLLKKDLQQEKAATELGKIAWKFRNKFEHIVSREEKAINSTKRLSSDTDLDRIIAEYVEDLKRYGKMEVSRFEDGLSRTVNKAGITFPDHMEESEARSRAQSLVPKRMFRAPLSTEAFREALGEEEYEWYEDIVKKDKDFRKKIYETFNFMDGKRTVYDIAKALSSEYSETSLEHLLKFMFDLEKTSFVSFK